MACLIFVTCPNEKVAKKISKNLLKKRLVACVNLIPKIKSMYWWEGRIEESCETLLLIKTEENLFNSVKGEVVKQHPYEIPEVVCVRMDRGNKEYLKWIKEVTRWERKD
jgi:periplasmic divalent cation tolerance protein